VLDIPGDNIEPPPSMGESMDTSFILGMGKVGDAVKILLDIDRVLSSDEVVQLTSAAGSHEAAEPVAAGASF
jgi:purine-binding chemotaxis protein CheW